MCLLVGVPTGGVPTRGCVHTSGCVPTRGRVPTSGGVPLLGGVPTSQWGVCLLGGVYLLEWVLSYTPSEMDHTHPQDRPLSLDGPWNQRQEVISYIPRKR